MEHKNSLPENVEWDLKRLSRDTLAAERSVHRATLGQFATNVGVVGSGVTALALKQIGAIDQKEAVISAMITLTAYAVATCITWTIRHDSLFQLQYIRTKIGAVFNELSAHERYCASELLMEAHVDPRDLSMDEQQVPESFSKVELLRHSWQVLSFLAQLFS